MIRLEAYQTLSLKFSNQVIQNIFKTVLVIDSSNRFGSNCFQKLIKRNRKESKRPAV